LRWLQYIARTANDLPDSNATPAFGCRFSRTGKNKETGGRFKQSAGESRAPAEARRGPAIPQHESPEEASRMVPLPRGGGGATTSFDRETGNLLELSL